MGLFMWGVIINYYFDSTHGTHGYKNIWKHYT